jgi:CRP-like cAMP-binding protein
VVLMTDRELLELAAKAAGYELTQWPDEDFLRAEVEPNWRPKWNPLADDGDALRLAVKLRMDLTQMTTAGRQQVLRVLGPGSIDRTYEIAEDDPYAATRRAIVRAAAEVGKGM